MTMAQLSLGSCAVLILCFASAARSQVDGWKPIVGTSSYSRVTQHLPSATINVENGEAIGENSVTYHGSHLVGSTAGAEDPILSVGASSVIDAGNEGRFLGDISSDYGGSSSKVFNGLYSTGEVGSDQCSVEKYALENEGTIQYEAGLPKLEQFTLCSWMRFTNHKGDHSIFTYSVDGEPREIQFWVANAQGASYFSLAVHGQSLFRLNYPLKLRKWHHACVSWNGKTGEWQLWVKAERVGRGFHNRLVGHVIKPHGVVYSGGPSITGVVASGLHMEVTMVQLYKVALSAGKAHRDHKHHHVHHFNHDGLAPTTQPPPPTQPPLPTNFAMGPNLANGQVATRLRINLAGIQPQDASVMPPTLQTQIVNGQTQFINGQFSVGQRLLAQQFASAGGLVAPSSSPILFPQEDDASSLPEAPSSSSSFVNLGDPANVQYIEEGLDSSGSGHLLYKRNNKQIKRLSKRRQRRHTVDMTSDSNNSNKNNKKRALVELTDGSIVDDKDLVSNSFIFDGLSQFGAVDFQENLSKHASIEDEIREHDREPAEDEVRAVLELCSTCEREPFQGAIVMAWKDAKIQTEHALRGHSLGGCGHF